MTNHKIKLEAIPGIQEIDDAAAANCNGGSIRYFDGENFGGDSFEIDNNAIDRLYNLEGLNNRISSFSISAGETWQFYTGKNGSGRSRIYVAGSSSSGNYSLASGEFGEDFNNRISSLKRVS